VILISSDDHYQDEDYAELIAGSPAVGFLSKATLSADAISRLAPSPPGDGAGRGGAARGPCAATGPRGYILR
jgi:hypothetical protein